MTQYPDGYRMLYSLVALIVFYLPGDHECHDFEVFSAHAYGPLRCRRHRGWERRVSLVYSKLIFAPQGVTEIEKLSA